MTCLMLFLHFFKIGLFTFGGGYAMIPLIKETVLINNWLQEEQFYNFLGVCEATPGPIAVNMATYIGSSQAGSWGSLCATIGVILPSFIIILLVATILTKLIKNKYFQSFLDGVKPVVIALILSAGLVLFLKAIGFNSNISFDFNLISLIVFSILAVGYCTIKYGFKRKVNNILFIVCSAVMGIVVSVCFLGF